MTGRSKGSRNGLEQLEGVHAVVEALKAGKRTIREIYLARSDEDSISSEIEDLAAQSDVLVHQVDRNAITQRAHTDAPQGVIALADPLPSVEIATLLENPQAFLVTVDGVTDPHNLGAVIRSAEAMGATGFLLPKHRTAEITPTVTKAAAGATEYLPVASIAGVPNFMQQAKRAGVWSVALDASGKTSIDDVAVLDQPILLILGAEGSGVSRLVLDKADVVASIEMSGRTESLNVSAAAAIACHAISQRRAANQ